eukprot:CAMPEP_0119488918 /NCGR_PEP_ID=MMETSP1344-20130328/14536_1 /TAXON_ID=236787 /ORGANISM="Florenciella parvula, Strain CCMP2471" /LENGTH=88 /DNA_ID=CAMNT_0007523911 /DNA_START=455 /DNA_END=721 /DNA_ORIENTATION=+
MSQSAKIRDLSTSFALERSQSMRPTGPDEKPNSSPIAAEFGAEHGSVFGPAVDSVVVACRDRQTTLWPPDKSSSTTWRPTKPVPPVTT